MDCIEFREIHKPPNCTAEQFLCRYLPIFILRGFSPIFCFANWRGNFLSKMLHAEIWIVNCMMNILWDKKNEDVQQLLKKNIIISFWLYINHRICHHINSRIPDYCINTLRNNFDNWPGDDCHNHQEDHFDMSSDLPITISYLSLEFRDRSRPKSTQK